MDSFIVPFGESGMAVTRYVHGSGAVVSLHSNLVLAADGYPTVAVIVLVIVTASVRLGVLLGAAITV